MVDNNAKKPATFRKRAKLRANPKRRQRGNVVRVSQQAVLVQTVLERHQAQNP